MAKSSIPEVGKGQQKTLYPETIKGADIGLRGMLGILACGGDAWKALADSELATIHNQACNIIEQSKNTVEAVGNLLSAHDRTINEVDTNMVGWSILAAMGTLQAMEEIRSELTLELERRGFSRNRQILGSMP